MLEKAAKKASDPARSNLFDEWMNQIISKYIFLRRLSGAYQTISKVELLIIRYSLIFLKRHEKNNYYLSCLFYNLFGCWRKLKSN